MSNKKKKPLYRHEYEVIVMLLIILTAAVLTLAAILHAQGEQIKDTQVLMQEYAEDAFDIEE